MTDQQPVKLWEILVPTQTNPDEDGNTRPIRVRQHRVWDEMVKQITGGLTITPPIKGVWIDQSDPDKTEYRERMIPVRIACTEDQIRAIAKQTAKFYDQLAVMVCLVSDQTIFYDQKSDSFSDGVAPARRELAMSHDFITSSEFDAALAQLAEGNSDPLPKKIALLKNIKSFRHEEWIISQVGTKTALKKHVKAIDRVARPGRFRLGVPSLLDKEGIS